MLTVFRWLGWLLVAAAAVVLIGELLPLLQGAAFRTRALGEIWFAIDNSSLNLVQAVIQRYVHPLLWDPVAIWLLSQPAVLVLGLPGLLLSWLARPRPKPPRILF